MKNITGLNKFRNFFVIWIVEDLLRLPIDAVSID